MITLTFKFNYTLCSFKFQMYVRCSCVIVQYSFRLSCPVLIIVTRMNISDSLTSVTWTGRSSVVSRNLSFIIKCFLYQSSLEKCIIATFAQSSVKGMHCGKSEMKWNFHSNGTG